VRPLIQRIIAYSALAFGGLVAALVLVIALAMGGCRTPFPPTEITQRQPYVNFVGRDYRIVSEVIAHAWNEYPDEQKISSVSLIRPPGVANRFVSQRVSLKPGQPLRIISAWQRLGLFGYDKYYIVSIPNAGLPENIPIIIGMNSDAVPDPEVYQPVAKTR
jgi:hypothetical protein